MKVINLDKNGNVIPDMSKVVLPDELQIKIINIILRSEKVEPADNQKVSASQQRHNSH